jgi:hypothetical protein
MKTYRSAKTVIALVFLAGLLTPAPSVALAASTTYGGQATAVRATVAVAGIAVGPLVLADTGPADPGGDARDATVLEYPIEGAPEPTNGALTAEVFHAAVVAGGNTSSAEASIADFTLTAAGQSIGADFLMSRASATCDGGSATTTGSSELAALAVNNERVIVTGAENQTVLLPNGLGGVVINEHKTARKGDITVNALHIVIVGGTDVVVSSAHADIACVGKPPPPCPLPNFVTGGGWIATPGGRANFAVAGGIKNGQPWGHLTYIDHGNAATKVKGTGVTKYQGDVSPQIIEGTADIDRKDGTYKAEVLDGGEPGRDVDTFKLSLSSLYSTGPDARLLNGGNIQLHCK